MNAKPLLALGSLVMVSIAAMTSSSAAGPQGPAPPYRVVNLQSLSGPTPFPDGCPGAAFDNEHIAGYEGEPSIAVSPRGPHTIVASWMQDVGPGIAARSDLVAASHDLGGTWTRGTIPGLTLCTGGTADSAGDPSLSFDAGGTAYFVGLGASLTPEGRIVEVSASHSVDRGATWVDRATVAAQDLRNDKPTITGDPILPGRAYAIWAHWDMQLNFPFTNLLKFARSSDRGATWSDPAVIDAPPPNAVDVSSAVLALPNSKLVAVFERIDIAEDFSATENFFAKRSLDGGVSWRPPVQIGSIPIAPLSDPETGDQLPQPGFLSAAVGRGGNMYVAWERQDSPNSGGIDVASSRNGGRTWTMAPLPGVTSFAFEPSIAVDSHGTVGLTWYDLRNDVPGDGASTADVWFAHSEDSGASWHETHVAGPTDLRSAPIASFNRFGEYQGLAALPSGFAAVFTLAAPQAKDGPTDIFFARIKRG